MTKKEFIKKVSADVTEKSTHKINQEAVSLVMEGMFNVVVDALNNGDTVKPIEGLTLSAVNVPEKTGRNPQTQEQIIVKAHVRPKAKFGLALKNALNQ
jgi:DNA-binding protein HU-beta